MPAFDETAILALGAEPIPGGPRGGVDAADDEQYIAVMAEMSKLARIGEEEPAWHTVELSGTNILRATSKDFEIATALACALFKRSGYAGLAAALGVLSGLVENFWEESFPERPRRRKARIEALALRFAEEGWFRDRQPRPDEFDAVDKCLERAAALEEKLKARLADDPPDLKKFLAALKDLAGKRPKPAAAPDAAPAGAAPATGAPAAMAPVNVQDVSGAVNAMLSAATFVQKAEPANPIPYAVVRAVKWSRFTLPPPGTPFQGRPPDPSIVNALAAQLAGGLWDHLLTGAEGAFRSAPAWLDLQRYSCSAMAQLGPTYEPARQTVIALTAAFIRRVGEALYDLRFSGGLPACGGETRMWLESEVMPAAGAGGGAAAAGSMSNGRLKEASDKARKLAGTGKLKEALQELREGLTGCTQRRDRFLWKVRIAQLCYDAQRLSVAAPLLEECYEEIRRFQVDEWEPGLAVEVAQTLYKCRKALAEGQKPPKPETLEGVRDSFAWLCQLDPVAALAAEPAGQ